jgi:hypothetical protein
MIERYITRVDQTISVHALDNFISVKTRPAEYTKYFYVSYFSLFWLG